MTWPRRHLCSRMGRLRWPWVASCFIGQPLALHTFKGEIGAGNVIDAKPLPEPVPEICTGR
jgi:hypothetical protein